LLSEFGGMQMALIVPLVCFAYVVFYVMKGYVIRPATPA
jgi:fucose permease